MAKKPAQDVSAPKPTKTTTAQRKSAETSGKKHVAASDESVIKRIATWAKGNPERYETARSGYDWDQEALDKFNSIINEI